MLNPINSNGLIKKEKRKQDEMEWNYKLNNYFHLVLHILPHHDLHFLKSCYSKVHTHNDPCDPFF